TCADVYVTAETAPTVTTGLAAEAGRTTTPRVSTSVVASAIAPERRSRRPGPGSAWLTLMLSSALRWRAVRSPASPTSLCTNPAHSLVDSNQYAPVAGIPPRDCFERQLENS